MIFYLDSGCSDDLFDVAENLSGGGEGSLPLSIECGPEETEDESVNEDD